METTHRHLKNAVDGTPVGRDGQLQNVPTGHVRSQISPSMEIDHIYESTKVLEAATRELNGEEEPSLRDLALHMQVVVGEILDHGGLSPEEWFDQLVSAQQRLAARTRGTEMEFRAIREITFDQKRKE